MVDIHNDALAIAGLLTKDMRGIVDNEQIIIERDSLTHHLIKEGELLPDSHEFAALCTKVINRLGLSNEAVLFAVDTESEGLAFYSPEALAVALGKGIFALLERNGLTVCEDHIAYIIAHEFAHAKRHKREEEQQTTEEKYQSGLKYSFAGHNQEHEADRVGMLHIAQAQYNPNAAIQVLEHFNNLETASASFSHPADRQRIIELQNILYDDEHPVANTQIDMTPLPETLHTWFNEPSDEVYESTDVLFSKNSAELHQIMMNASSSQEFLLALKIYQHAVRVEKARALASDGLFQKLMRKAAVASALSEKTLVWKGNESKNSLKLNRSDMIEKAGAALKAAPTEGFLEAHELIEPKQVTALLYRTSLPADTAWFDEHRSEYRKSFSRYMRKLDGFVNYQLERKPITPGSPEDELLKIYNGQSKLSSDVIINCFPDRTPGAIEERIEKEQKKRQQNGIAPLTNIELAERRRCALDMENKKKEIMEAVTITCAMAYVEKTPITEELFVKLASLLVAENGFSESTGMTTSRMLLTESRIDAFNHINEIPSDERLGVAVACDKLWDAGGFGRISYRRPMHKSFVNSFKGIPLTSGDDGPEIQMLQTPPIQGYAGTLVAYSFINSRFKGNQMVVPPSDEELFDTFVAKADVSEARSDYQWGGEYEDEEVIEKDHVDSVDEFDINLKEWNELKMIANEYDNHYRARAIRDYIKAMREGTVPTQEVLAGVMEHKNSKGGYKYFPEQAKLSAEDITLLLEHSPWGVDDTHYYLVNALSIALDEHIGNPTQAHQEQLLSAASTLLSQAPDPHVFDKYGKETRENYELSLLSIRRKALRVADIGRINETDLGPSVADTLNFCIEEKIIGSVADIAVVFVKNGTYQRSHITDFLLTADGPALNKAAELLANSEAEHAESFSLAESFRLMAEFPPVPLAELEGITQKVPSRDQIPQRFFVLLSEVAGEPHPGFIKHIIDAHGAQSVDWICKHFHSSFARNRLVAAVSLMLDMPAQKNIFDHMPGLVSDWQPDHEKETTRPVRPIARASAVYDFEYQYVYEGRGFERERLIATTEDEYNDLFLRRHPFVGIGFTPQEANGPHMATIYRGSYDDYQTRFDSVFPSDMYYPSLISGSYDNRGNYEQRLLALSLHEVQDTLIDISISFEQRLQLIQERCPVVSVVRDIHLERMLRTELTKNKKESPEELIRRGDALFNMFAKHELTDFYGAQLIDLHLRVDGNALSRNVEEGLMLIRRYLPEPSLKRNYYLSLVEQRCRITPADMDLLNSLRITEELESREGEGYYVISILNHLSAHTQQSEKRETLMWLMGISAGKPRPILDLETKWDGNLDSAPAMFATLTPDERSVVLNKFLLGSQGIIDLTQSEQLYSLDYAQSQRLLFLLDLSVKFIPDSFENCDVFRNLFIETLEKGDPVRCAHIISKLINQLYDAVKQNREFTPEEVLANGLCSLNVVGKKSAQSLAEMEWVPEDFASALATAQENADQIPKRALVEMARQNGYLNEGAPIQIVAFGEILGAASNKQACKLTVKVNNEEILENYNQYLRKKKKPQIKLGDEIEVVGKFKRPSAQKVENLHQDLSLLKHLLEYLSNQGDFVENLPPRFEDQIKVPILRELNFKAEAEFNRAMAKEVDAMGSYKGFSLEVPFILNADSDIVIETIAQGTSLRKLMDKENPDEAETRALFIGKEANLFILLSQMLVTGHIHADLQPGNMYVDPLQAIVNPIDLGMNATLESAQIVHVRSLLFALATGNTERAHGALHGLGWNITQDELELEGLKIKERILTQGVTLIRHLPGIKTQPQPEGPVSLHQVMAHNIEQLLEVSKTSSAQMPEEVLMLVFAASKLVPCLDTIDISNYSYILGRIGLLGIKQKLSAYAAG